MKQVENVSDGQYATESEAEGEEVSECQQEGRS